MVTYSLDVFALYGADFRALEFTVSSWTCYCLLHVCDDLAFASALRRSSSSADNAQLLYQSGNLPVQRNFPQGTENMMFMLIIFCNQSAFSQRCPNRMKGPVFSRRCWDLVVILESANSVSNLRRLIHYPPQSTFSSRSLASAKGKEEELSQQMHSLYITAQSNLVTRRSSRIWPRYVNRKGIWTFRVVCWLGSLSTITCQAQQRPARMRAWLHKSSCRISTGW